MPINIKNFEIECSASSNKNRIKSISDQQLHESIR